MSERNWPRTTFYALSSSFAAATWIFHLAGAVAVVEWLDKWQTLVGALAGGGAAIVAGRYALHAARLPIEAAQQDQARLEAQARAQYYLGMMQVLTAIFARLRSAWRARCTEMDVQQEWGSEVALRMRINIDAMASSATNLINQIGFQGIVSQRAFLRAHRISQYCEEAREIMQTAIKQAPDRTPEMVPEFEKTTQNMEVALLSVASNLFTCASYMNRALNSDKLIYSDPVARDIARRTVGLYIGILKAIKNTDIPEEWEAYSMAATALAELGHSHSP